MLPCYLQKSRNAFAFSFHEKQPPMENSAALHRLKFHKTPSEQQHLNSCKSSRKISTALLVRCRLQVAGSKHPESTKKLLLLNAVPVVFGLANVVSSQNSVPGTPSCFVSYTSASLVFLPSLLRCLREQDRAHILAGAELALWTFAHSILSDCTPPDADTCSTCLLYVLTVTFPNLFLSDAAPQTLNVQVLVVPALQTHAAPSNLIAWLALASSLLDLGLLEEQGNGWRAFSLPVPDISWALLQTAFSLMHLLRADSLAKSRDPSRLQAVQLATLSLCSCLLHAHDISCLSPQQAASVPWLVLKGFLCTGLGSLLEICAARGVENARVTINYTLIPLWGAFFLLLRQGRPVEELVLLLGLLLGLSRLCFFVCNQCGSQPQQLPEQLNEGAKQEEERKLGSHLPAVLLSSQLKFPYYTNQAQLLTDLIFGLSTK